MTRVLVRCDGHAAVGLGHVSRCAGLAEALDELGTATSFHGAYNDAARCLIDSTGADVCLSEGPASGSVEDAEETLRVAASLGADVLVVDGYLFGQRFLAALAQARTGRGLVVIDDFAAVDPYPHGACIVNSTFQAQGLRYRGDGLRLFAGPEYLLVRRALRTLRAQGNPPTCRSPLRCLVALGGIDRFGRTLAVVEALASLPSPPDVDVVLSESSPVRERVADRLARWPGRGRLFGPLPSLADRFARCDACISAGGLTMYEACYLGRPVAVWPQSREETRDAADAAAAGIVVNLSAATEGGPRVLAAALDRFFTRSSLDALRGAAAGRFPSDPTRRAARALGYLSMK
jgi:spore coat polysaccharide biosynthesis predicted glycosyltransferase SpsG